MKRQTGQRLLPLATLLFKRQSMASSQMAACTLSAGTHSVPLNNPKTTRKFSSTRRAQSPELSQLVNDKSLIQSGAHIGGDWLKSSSTFDVYNPATGQPIASVSNCGSTETDAAISAAASAFPAWAARPAKDRASIMRRWYELILASKDDITKLMTIECGKPLAESRNEFDGGAESVAWFADEARRIDGDVLQTPARDKRFIVLRQPLGVVGSVTPWNFPFSMITRKTAPAIAAGCTVVLKPSELTPLTALALAELGKRAGLPDGVFNIVPTNTAKAVGDALTASPLVRKIGFTGSTAVGKALYAAAAPTVKRVSLELGGNAPFIIFEDADLDKAARDVVLSSYRNAGQTCICTNRVLVAESIHDIFAEKLVKKVQNLKLGNGMQNGITHGPMITGKAVDTIEAKVSEAVGAGAKVATGGNRPQFHGDNSLLNQGYFFEPTVLTNVDQSMRIFKEESFAPVTPLVKFSTEEEALQLANGTPYGLAAYFYTQNLSRAWRVSEALQFGMVGVNEVAITSENVPFGGVKESGLGRENSKYGILEYLDLKTVCLGI
jgi:succinate-semialdehyde dehydrogenase / glutarate-semialdehyde dehydrogenase